MITQQIQDALNRQLNLELYGAYCYLSMAAYFHTLNLNGFASWMQVQAQEEMMHASKFFDFIVDRDGEVNLQEIKAPPKSWQTALEVFEYAFQQEKKISTEIHSLVDMSLEHRDHASNTFLQWFVTEQVEEEATISGLIDTLKLVGSDGNGLFLMNRDLAQRSFKNTEEGGE